MITVNLSKFHEISKHFSQNRCEDGNPDTDALEITNKTAKITILQSILRETVEVGVVQTYEHLVDLEKRSKTSSWLLTSASIQRRSSSVIC